MQTCYKRPRSTDIIRGDIISYMATSKKGSAPKASSAAVKGKRMTQSEVLNHFATRLELTRAQVKELIDEMAALATREVQRNGEFALPGFGKLVLSKRKAREGRNPQTGETIQIAAKTALKFRLGKAMKDSVTPARKK